jgi:hypothetical protein
VAGIRGQNAKGSRLLQKSSMWLFPGTIHSPSAREDARPPSGATNCSTSRCSANWRARLPASRENVKSPTGRQTGLLQEPRSSCGLPQSMTGQQSTCGPAGAFRAAGERPRSCDRHSRGRLPACEAPRQEKMTTGSSEPLQTVRPASLCIRRPELPPRAVQLDHPGERGTRDAAGPIR